MYVIDLIKTINYNIIKLNFSAFLEVVMKLMEIGYETVHDHDFSIVRPNGYRGYLFLLIKTASFHVIKK